MSIKDNLTLSSLKKYASLSFLNLRKEESAARASCTELKVKCSHVLQEVDSLSGGNQQKVAIARLLHHHSDIFLLDEPTRGVDVGSKAEIYQIIFQLAAAGKSVIFVSSYLPE